MKQKVLGIIPARGGSKGIPGKNIKLLGGKPLLEYTVDVARESEIFDRIILSTDTQEIAAVGKRLGIEVPFLRPAELAQDDTAMLPVLQNVVQFCEDEGWIPDVVVILQPTSPFRRASHLRKGYELLCGSQCDSVVSVEAVPGHYSPHVVMKIREGVLSHFLDEGAKVTRRQDAETAYTRNGYFYFTRRELIMGKNTIYGEDCRPVIIDEPDTVNLDTMEDWLQAEHIINK